MSGLTVPVPHPPPCPELPPGGLPLAAGLSARTRLAAREVLAGRRRGLRAALPFAGPAIVASIAYVDPGNFATNIQAGAAYGYSLLWVVLAANLVAMFFQALSARLGIVTGLNLAEACRQEFPRPLVLGMWGASEIAAAATDLAEFLGAAVGLALLAHLPLLAGMGVVAVVTYGLLLLEGRGFRPLELVIAGFVATIGLCYLAELLIAPIHWREAATGLVSPRLPDGGAIALAVGIVGATVMPHALYLHSSLTQCRIEAATAAERRLLVRWSNMEVVGALALAGCVNIAMVLMAASAFHAGHPEVAEIETAYHTLGPLLGHAAAAAFLVSLLASGVSSSVVGTMAGQVIMQGFLRRRIPIWVRRLVTMLPAFAVVGAGADATQCLVLSQVVLSLVLPVPVIALTVLSRRRALMGDWALGPIATAAAAGGAALVVTLNLVLLISVL